MSNSTYTPKLGGTDVRRRAVLQTTLQNLVSSAGGTGTKGGVEGDELKSSEYLDKVEEELNRKVDAEVGVLVEGMEEMVKLAQVGLLSFCLGPFLDQEPRGREIFFFLFGEFN
jgi:hypothetical protein